MVVLLICDVLIKIIYFNKNINKINPFLIFTNKLPSEKSSYKEQPQKVKITWQTFSVKSNIFEVRRKGMQVIEEFKKNQ